MQKFKIKICGMRETANIAAIASLMPDYMGFILYKKSPRYISPEESICLARSLQGRIKTVAVLVNEPLEKALEIAGTGAFDLLQLHGNESPAYCEKLHHHVGLIKAFHVSGHLPADLNDYEPFCRMFLFDTAGASPGGNGKRFDHNLLAGYACSKEFLLSGGISPSDSDYLRSAVIPGMAGIDLNSRFELSPGVKDTGLLKTFMENLRKDDKD